MKIIILIILMSIFTFGWEINTHRAIDQTAILSGKSTNFYNFLSNSSIGSVTYNDRDSLMFVPYKTTYTEYIKNGEIDGISKWGQTISIDTPSAIDLIEAGCILEDAVWAGGLFSGDGRFNNHFYDPQNGGKSLSIGWGSRTNAVSWAKNGGRNSYSFDLAQRWFKNGFTLSSQSERRKYQAKMLVSVGHIMHMLNDMNVPAHTRDDSHPFGDPLEVWMRGGEEGNENTGFYVRGSSIANTRYSIGNLVRYDGFENGMKREAVFTSQSFFSADTIFHKPLLDYAYSPSKHDVTIPELDPNHPADYDYITDSSGRKLAVVYKSGWFGKERITLDYGGASDVVHNDYGKTLIPRAIANAAGFVNYFFRGSMEAVANPCGVTVTNDSNDSLVASPDVVTFRKEIRDKDNNKIPGKISIYYDKGTSKENATRVKLREYTLKKDLPVGESITIPYEMYKDTYDQMLDHKLIVVFVSCHQSSGDMHSLTQTEI